MYRYCAKTITIVLQSHGIIGRPAFQNTNKFQKQNDGFFFFLLIHVVHNMVINLQFLIC